MAISSGSAPSQPTIGPPTAPNRRRPTWNSGRRASHKSNPHCHGSACQLAQAPLRVPDADRHTLVLNGHQHAAENLDAATAEHVRHARPGRRALSPLATRGHHRAPTRPRVVVAGRADESETKTNADARSLALDPITWEALSRHVSSWRESRQLLGQSTQLLFVWPDDRPLHPDTITSLFHRHADAAGLPRIRLQDVRHSYATAGISPKVLSEWLGHSTGAFTLQTYTHVIPTMDAQAATAAAKVHPAIRRPRASAWHRFRHHPHRNGREPGALQTDLGANLRSAVVAGAGFEPAASGRDQRHCDYFGFGPRATDSLGVVRVSSSLRISDYASGAEWGEPNVDRRWTPLKSDGVTHVTSLCKAWDSVTLVTVPQAILMRNVRIWPMSGNLKVRQGRRSTEARLRAGLDTLAS